MRPGPIRRPCRTRVRRALLALSLAGLGGLAGPALAQPVALRDDRGVEHRFVAPPRRIVALLPSLTEIVCALGGCSRLVGVDDHSDWPPELAGRRLPRVGGLYDARIEAIVGLRPDVVLASTSARSLDRLEALGIVVLRLDSDTHADVRRTLDTVARLLGTPAEAERVWTQVQQQVDAAAARVPVAMRGRRAYFEIGGGPYAAGAASFIGETLTRLGIGNIVPPELGPFPKLNPEFVVRARPDLILGARDEQAALAARPGWATLPAIRLQRMCGFDSGTYEMLIRPGPRLGDAAEAVVACLVRIDPTAPARPAASAGVAAPARGRVSIGGDSPANAGALALVDAQVPAPRAPAGVDARARTCRPTESASWRNSGPSARALVRAPT